jgi:hypothetical protein
MLHQQQVTGQQTVQLLLQVLSSLALRLQPLTVRSACSSCGCTLHPQLREARVLASRPSAA